MGTLGGNAKQRRAIKRIIDEAIQDSRHQEALPKHKVQALSEPNHTKLNEKLLQQITSALILAPAAIFPAYVYLDPTPNTAIGTIILLIGLAAIAGKLWLNLNWSNHYKFSLCVVFFLICGYFTVKWAVKVTRPSFAYVMPGPLVGQPQEMPLDGAPPMPNPQAKMDTWYMAVYHYGPKSSDNVSVLFDDSMQQDRVLNHTTYLSPSMRASFERNYTFGDVNPKWHGQLTASYFFWTPQTLGHERYELMIFAKDRNVIEELRIEKVNNEWTWYMTVKDKDTRKVLLSCQEGDFPNGDKKARTCKSLREGDD